MIFIISIEIQAQKHATYMKKKNTTKSVQAIHIETECIYQQRLQYYLCKLPNHYVAEYNLKCM